MNILHLGILIKDKETNYISKEVYLAAKPEGMSWWTEEADILLRNRASLNYVMNMRYIETLDRDEFNRHFHEQCEKFNLMECKDLKQIANLEGLYIMVLDKYKQVYIGISSDMKKRIMQHWNKKKSLERLVFGDICNSVLSIDSFGALDTTRVFYIATSSVYQMEENVVNSFDSRFILNRTGGGIGSEETGTSEVAIAVMANKRNRDLKPFASVVELEKIESEVKEYTLKRVGSLE